MLARELRRRGSPVRTIYAVIMPKQRRTMHLDTIFTFLSRDECLVYPPLILPGGGEQVGIVRLSRDGRGVLRADTEHRSLIALPGRRARPPDPRHPLRRRQAGSTRSASSGPTAPTPSPCAPA